MVVHAVEVNVVVELEEVMETVEVANTGEKLKKGGQQARWHTTPLLVTPIYMPCSKHS